MPTSILAETSLYAPAKRFLERLGYEVKGEIGGCDLVAVCGQDRVLVIGELKLRFNLELVLQGVERLAACDEVWLAVHSGGRSRRHIDPRVRKLCRLLGFGLLQVSSTGEVALLSASGPYQPRSNPRRRSKLLDEFRRRRGDPTPGGSFSAPVMTAYRQQALSCAAALATAPARPRDLKAYTPLAPKILYRNVYGWFTRIDRGLYGLTEDGRAALLRWPADSIGEDQRRCEGAAPAAGFDRLHRGAPSA